MSTLTIRPVKDKAGTMAFLKVPFSVFSDDSNWVAPLFLERLEHRPPQFGRKIDFAAQSIGKAQPNAILTRVSRIDHFR